MESNQSIGKRWRILSGSGNWEGLFNPLDSDLRRYLIHYGSMVGAIYDSFISDTTSKHAGLSRYARKNLLSETGVDHKANPFKYTVTKYFYAPSTVWGSHQHKEYFVKSVRVDAVVKESNWIGYVAVASDEGVAALGRRDILVVWRGTGTTSEWIEDFTIAMVKAPLIFGQDDKSSEVLVHQGWYNMYTSINQEPNLERKSARDQIREEVSRLMDLYKDEEISITVTGHSLGSSMATLTAVDLALNNPSPSTNFENTLITAFLYASPKVGDTNLKDVFTNQKNLRALRIVNHDDLVPRVPILGPKQGAFLQFVSYVDVGVEFVVNASKSEYLRVEHGDIKKSLLMWHGLMVYLHGIDGFVGPHGGFSPQGCFDVSQINKYGAMLKVDKCLVPSEWWVPRNKGMVQNDDGTWNLVDHEPDTELVTY